MHVVVSGFSGRFQSDPWLPESYFGHHASSMNTRSLRNLWDVFSVSGSLSVSESTQSDSFDPDSDSDAEGLLAVKIKITWGGDDSPYHYRSSMTVPAGGKMRTKKTVPSSSSATPVEPANASAAPSYVAPL